ncbi:MAG: aromatic acid exporter family protein [Bacillota bacterium]|nr:aromatic acid exporter family protein [Bacillota bacterium]MDP4171330.1 aromatic acid exporter family protein [Bacillota bacterium]
MKLGARILKTGIAIILSLYLGQLVHSPSPVFAGIAAIFAVQPTIYRSYLSIIEQIQGNLIGALLAVIFVITLGNHIVVIGLAAIIVISINLKLKIENTIGLSLVTLVAIMESTNGNFILFSIIRFSTIMLGVLAAFIVNLVFLPPKYETKLYLRISNTTEEILRWIRLSTRNASDHTLLKNDIDKLKDSMLKIGQLYLMYKEERNFFKKNDLVKTRKLVIYRQMISATKKALDTLKRLHRYENEVHLLPESLKQSIQAQLDCLLHHHEQLMLRFIGKIRHHTIHEDGALCLNKKELFELFLSRQQDVSDQNESYVYHAMQIVATIIDYGEQVEHLETLITSFQSYHNGENEITIEDQSL